MSVKFSFEEHLQGLKTGKIWAMAPKGRPFMIVTCPKCLTVEFVVPGEERSE